MRATRIDVEPGDAGWLRAKPLLQEVWSPEVVATLPWRDVVWALADKRVLVAEEQGDVLCHVGLFLRDATWDDRLAKIGGIGGVATRADSRRRGLAGSAMQRAAQEMRDVDSVDFGFLTCAPHLVPFYQRLGWRPFQGEIFVEQPQGRIRLDLLNVTGPMVLDLALAPRSGVLDLRGRPW
jgi:aminoglycoside 2'-N-acetyltransferase I